MSSIPLPSRGSGPAAHGDAAHGSVRVLIVGNGGQTRRMLQQASENGDLTVCSVPEAGQALNRLRGQTFDAVILELPVARRMAGELRDAVQDMGAELRDRLIFVVADLIDPDVRRLLMQVGRPFLTRPVDGAELTDLVRRVAGSGR